MTHILYSFRRCPYAMRARMALKYSGVKVKIHEVSLKNKPESMLQISPKGQVPVLLTSDGRVIDESMDIILFALSLRDEDGWLGKDENVRKQMDEYIKINDNGFKKSLDQYKYYDGRKAGSLEEYRSQGEEFLAILDKQLRDKQYVFGDKMLYGDIAIFPFIRQFAHVDKEWFYQSGYDYVIKWLDNLLASALFKEIMVKDLQAL